MQYWKPDAADEFAGDMMPYWDGERFHLFYLLDRDHHAERDGLGGHRWAHASTADLVTWEHHPLALPVGGPGSADENGICTGSILERGGVFHAFYAARRRAADGSVSERLCRAAGRDLIRFDKSAANPLFGASPGYEPQNFRDPFVFRHPETGAFHLLVTASRDGRGALAHYTSPDLEGWRLEEPFLSGRDGHSPECPEHFLWNGWWYLLYSHDGRMEYRISRGPLGPWHGARADILEPSTLRVPRTALWRDGRRLAVGFLPWREGGRDSGGYVYAGSAVFREVFQDADGTLSTRFVPEMMPPTGPPARWRLAGGGVQVPDGGVAVGAGGSARIEGVPADCVLSLRLVPGAGADGFGLLLRAGAQAQSGYRLQFAPRERQVTLASWPPAGGGSAAVLTDVERLDRPVDALICLQGSALDVSLNGRHTLIERGFDFDGTHLGLFAESGTARLEDLAVSPIL